MLTFDGEGVDDQSIAPDLIGQDGEPPGSKELISGEEILKVAVTVDENTRDKFSFEGAVPRV